MTSRFHKTLMLNIFFYLTLILVGLTACQPQNDKSNHQISLNVDKAALAPIEKKSYPILFVTQVPTAHDQNTRLSAFANHRTSVVDVPRGGDLMLLYPDGELRNLTQEAGFGMSGLQGDKAIAVREPAIHPNGKKAIFSMLVGSPKKLQTSNPYRWQLYEVEGLDRHEKAKIKKLSKQDPRFNNLSPLYADDGSIIFTSDRPRTGELHLYPQLDEYEATPSISGIWKLNPSDGKLQLLSHTPSGAFTPIIDSFGRVIFTRWDHLQQDQLADRDRDAERNGVKLPFNSFNFADESPKAKPLRTRTEIFPESRVGGFGKYGDISPYRSNFFTLWQIDQNGINEETVNHIGQHELTSGFSTASFSNDMNLSGRTYEQFYRNRLYLRREGGIFHLREDPLEPGTFFGISARESASFTTDSIVKISARPELNPEQMQVVAVTKIDKGDNLKDGRYRNPLPLSDGRLIASHTSHQLPPERETSLQDLRLSLLERDSATGFYTVKQKLSSGFQKNLSWWNGNKLETFNGILWEIEAVEVKPRALASTKVAALEKPEQAIFQEEGVDEASLRAWLSDQNLALIVTRNQTSRDRADQQQPFNLRVPNGVTTMSKAAPKGLVYDIQHFQILQAEQVRAYPDRPGRRHLAQTIKDFHPLNQQQPEMDSSVIIAKDGSTAALVPAERALTWQTTDQGGNPVVRERNWITFKSGEIRVCAACHGVNQFDQAGFPAPMNKPEALRELLARWKKISKNSASPAK